MTDNSVFHKDKNGNLGKFLYRKLKHAVYFENYDLFIKERLAKFEVEHLQQGDLYNWKELKKWDAWIADFRLMAKDFLEIIQEIDCHILPKKIIKNDDRNTGGCISSTQDDENFISNDKMGSQYKVESVNYVIDCPIQIYLLDMLWTCTVGKILDDQFHDVSWGNRIADDVSTNELSLFKHYPKQYADWRDGGLKAINEHLEIKDSTLVMLDIKQCYYHINTRWSDIAELIHSHYSEFPEKAHEKKLCLVLNCLLKKVHKTYWGKIKDCLIRTNGDFFDDNKHIGLPIGLYSSAVLCNYHLDAIDSMIISKAKPYYYGRYVDDMLFVFDTQDRLIEGVSRDTEGFMGKLFVDTEVLQENTLKGPAGVYDSKYYSFFEFDSLHIQKEKVRVIYLKRNQSRAVLNNFIRELRMTVSEFRFLPEAFMPHDLDSSAYDLEMDGSIHRLRSIKNIKENSTLLKGALYRLIIQNSLSSFSRKKEDEIIELLFRFFVGENLLSNFTLWELVFTVLIITSRKESLEKFQKKVREKIELIKWEIGDKIDELLADSIKEDLQRFCDICYALPLALCCKKKRENNELANMFRRTFLFRSQHVCYPLVEYCNYDIDLFDLKMLDDLKPLVKISEDVFVRKLKRAPRYIHIDEKQLYWLLKSISNGEDSFSCPVDKDYLGLFGLQGPEDEGDMSVRVIDQTKQDRNKILCFDRNQQDDVKTVKHYIVSPRDLKNETSTLKIAITNIKLNHDDIKRNLTTNRMPNITVERKAELHKILNQAEHHAVDLIMLPECSVPYIWLPHMVKWVRKHKIGVVFGMEHWTVNGKAYNFIATLLPFEDDKWRRGCYVNLRLKNHYSPKEVGLIRGYDIEVPDHKTKKYDLFNWRGVQFAPYCCFELTNMKDRSIFLSDLDLLIACVYNKDTKYFSNILESTCRDLHCFTIQVNNSEWGDSRVIQPTESEKLNITRVSGGENNTVHIAKLEIQKLRNFQYVDSVYNDDKSFKPLPAGFDRSRVIKRKQTYNQP